MINKYFGNIAIALFVLSFIIALIGSCLRVDDKTDNKTKVMPLI